MRELTDYLKLQKHIFDYFGYKQDWIVIPLDDCRKHYWRLTGESEGDSVCFAETEKELREQGGRYWECELFTYVNLKKWVYRGPEYTLVVVDTHTDGNKFLSIFDNANERPIPNR